MKDEKVTQTAAISLYLNYLIDVCMENITELLILVDGDTNLMEKPALHPVRCCKTKSRRAPNLTRLA